ncbi:VWA domain-containing protein [Candidatus Micrarchaeota archaeon]|nr:VWA domain-containing protein [Candidatus Micrarchaeota archaeon]
MASPSNAQASVEFLLILAVSMVVIMMIVILAQQQITTVQAEKDSMDAQNSLLDLSSAAREVYAQGEGSKKLVFIRLPSSYEPSRSFVGNKSIQIRAAGTDHVSVENFNVRGYLPGTPGGHWVWVTSEGNRVRIGLAMMELDKNRIYVVMDSNSSASRSFSIKNAWVRNISVETATTWTTADVQMSGVPSAFQLSVNGSELINVQFASSAESAGFYIGAIELDASDGTGAVETVTVPVTVEVINPNQPLLPVKDIQGPIITNIYQVPTPAVKTQPLAIYVNATDSLTGNHTISGCQIDADNSGNWQTMLPVDGAYDQVTELSVFNYTSGFTLGPHTVRAKCTDFLNNTGPLAYYYFNVSEADQLGPIVIQMYHTDYATTISNISVGGIATDAYTGGNDVSGCNVKVDSGGWHPATPGDGTWNSTTENFTYNVGPVAVGIHSVYYQCNDSVGNVGGIYNDTFGVVDVDLMLVLDRSGSMAWNVTNATNSAIVSASSTGWSSVKTLSVTAKNGELANLTTEIRSSTSNCLTSFNVTIGGVQVATGNTTSTSYVYFNNSINITNVYPPFTVTLWLKRNATGCTAYNGDFSIQQAPIKMAAAQNGSEIFLDIAGNQVQAGLVSFSTSATTNEQLAMMTPSNQGHLKDAIDALTASGTTCIECGLTNACTELNSSRSRPTASKVVVLLTDGVGNVCKDTGSCTGTECMGCSVAGAVYCRDRDVTVYTIGFGNDVDESELTNIALLTGGDYYFAPNVATLTAIFQSIGRH